MEGSRVVEASYALGPLTELALSAGRSWEHAAKPTHSRVPNKLFI
jgi:hypothetical protein